MNHYLIICAILTTLLLTSSQKLEIRIVYRNFTIESETDSIYLVNITTYHEEDTPKTNCTFNVTKDVHVKHIQAYWNRCSFETLSCEFYQSRKIRNDLRSFVYKGTNFWTPAINSVTPKLDFPIVKKNIYRVVGAYFHQNLAVTLYPNAVNYFWRFDVAFIDHSDRNAAVLKFEYDLVQHVLKQKNSNSTTSESAEATRSKNVDLGSGSR